MGVPFKFVCFSANLAEQYGCAGLLLYSDPIDYTLTDQGVYPDDWYLPGSGAQRGTVKMLSGDPLTPHYPAIGCVVKHCS